MAVLLMQLKLLTREKSKEDQQWLYLKVIQEE
jgi:hypothetical protein